MTASTVPRTAEPTPESQQLAELEQLIADTRALLSSAWGDEATEHLAKLETARRDLLGLTATSVLGA